MEPLNSSHCLRSDKLNLEYLAKFPVWGKFDNDDSELIRPVVESDPFTADCDPLIIRARFLTVEGIEMHGSVSVDRAFDQVYLVQVFHGESWFGFHRRLVDLAAEDLEKLRLALGDSKLRIFPLIYETQMKNQNRDFSGTFNPF